MFLARTLPAAASLVLLAGLAQAQTYTNVTPVAIPASGNASPYPSTITVSGMPSQPVRSIQVRLLRATHEEPGDLEILLVAPNGQSVLLMSDNYPAEQGLSNTDVLFDDDAPLWRAGVDPSLGIRPEDYSFPGENLPAPAPQRPYLSRLADLASAIGPNVNGNWALYVADDTSPYAGQFAGGWSITFNGERAAIPSPTRFTYQGRLEDGGQPVTGSRRMRFAMWDHPTSTHPSDRWGYDQLFDNVQVENGLFTVNLDFFEPDVLDPKAKWLQIEVWSPARGWESLNPRQELTASPFAAVAKRAVNAISADRALRAATVDSVPWTSVTGAPTPYFTAAGSGARLTNADNLGIGSINPPTARLHIRNSVALTAANTAVFEAPIAGPHASHIHFGPSGDWYIRSANPAGKVVIQDSGGWTGIGTNNPASAFHVAATGGTAVVGGLGVHAGRDSGGNARLEVVNNSGINGTAYIDFTNESSMDYRGRIALTGQGVGSTLNLIAPAVRVEGNFINNSDARDKRDIRPISGALDLVGQLRGTRYFWAPTSHNGNTMPPNEQIGFIAQEVESVLPEIVSTDAKGYKGVSYTSLIPVLVEAVKELRSENEALRRRLEKLESR